MRARVMNHLVCDGCGHTMLYVAETNENEPAPQERATYIRCVTQGCLQEGILFDLPRIELTPVRRTEQAKKRMVHG